MNCAQRADTEFYFRCVLCKFPSRRNKSRCTLLVDYDGISFKMNLLRPHVEMMPILLHLAACITSRRTELFKFIFERNNPEAATEPTTYNFIRSFLQYHGLRLPRRQTICTEIEKPNKNFQNTNQKWERKAKEMKKSLWKFSLRMGVIYWVSLLTLLDSFTIKSKQK